jgi:hypothetical protein
VVRNVAAHARGDQDGGLFADDRGLGEWLKGQLDGDLRYLNGTLAATQRALTTTMPAETSSAAQTEDDQANPLPGNVSH